MSRKEKNPLIVAYCRSACEKIWQDVPYFFSYILRINANKENCILVIRKNELLGMNITINVLL